MAPYTVEHIAHNVTGGEHSLVVAQVGIAGSSTIGSHVILAGHVGVADNATVGRTPAVFGTPGAVAIVAAAECLARGRQAVGDPAVGGVPASVGDHVTVGGKSTITSGQKVEANQTVWGTPARPIDEVKRQLGAHLLLPKLLEQFHKLEKRLKALEDSITHSNVGPSEAPCLIFSLS